MGGPLAGRVALLTGAAGGIGAALAHELAAAGARLALLDVDAERLQAVAETLRAAGHPAAVFPCDIRDPAACADAVRGAEAALGDIDLLINNAGTSHRSLFEDTDLSVIRRVVEVNFFGAVHCTAAALPGLRRSRGQIVVVSSVAGFAPLVGRTGYSASKHALHGFFDSLRSELRTDGVDVLMVCPSFIATGLEQRALDGSGAPLGAGPRAVAGRVLTPERVARDIVRATVRRQRLLLLSPVARAAYWISRLAPAIYERLMLRRQGAEFAASR